MTSRSVSRRCAVAAAIGAPFFTWAARAAEAAWPQRAVRVVNAFGPGSGTDAFARIYGDYVAQQTGHPWVHEYKLGANGSMAAAEVKRAAADGHTLLFTISTTLIQNRVLYRTLPYDPDKDLSLVTFMPAGSLPLIVSPARTSATDLREFVEQMRGNPRAAVGTYGPGTMPHIVFTELNKQYGLDMQLVHYRGAVQMWTDLAGGVIDAGLGSYSSALPFLQKGLARVIAATPDRIPALPGVASCAEQGARSAAFRLMGYYCCAATGGTPPAIVERISATFEAASRSEKIRATLARAGLEFPALPVQESQRRYAAETPLWIGFVKTLGLSPE